MLRKGTDSFDGVDDAYAAVVHVGDGRTFVDAEGLQNEVVAFYRPYYLIAGSWVEGQGNHGTPAATYVDHSTDTVAFLRERLERGLMVECERGNFSTEMGYIQVFTAPPSLEQNIQFPLVTVQLDSELPADRAIGEDIFGEEDWTDESAQDSEGWLAAVQVSVVGWSLNSDERIELRKALRRLVLTNLPVFDGYGFQQVSLQQSDVDAVNDEYGAPVYQTVGTFTCIAPVRVASPVGLISEVVSTLND